MRILVASGKGISNRKILEETNKYFRTKNSLGYNLRVIPVEKEGFVVCVSPYSISFEIFNQDKSCKETIKKFIEYVFKGKTIGISTTQKCDWLNKLDGINIKYI